MAFAFQLIESGVPWLAESVCRMTWHFQQNTGLDFPHLKINTAEGFFSLTSMTHTAILISREHLNLQCVSIFYLHSTTNHNMTSVLICIFRKSLWAFTQTKINIASDRSLTITTNKALIIV